MNAMDDRMIRAYATAHLADTVSATQPPVLVSIHVGQDGWDWMRRKATVDEPSKVAGQPWRAKAWGFPVLLENAWHPSRIEVWTKQVIS